MREYLPWLCQGDVFESVPLPGAGAWGPAVLLTHDCNLDKASGKGDVAIARIQFAPLIDTASNPSLRGQLRKGSLNPPEAVLVGKLPAGWEGFLLLGEMFTLPADHFEPELVTFPPGPENPEPDFPHLRCTREGNRLARMEEVAIRLLHEKMVLFWTRQQLSAAEAVAASVVAGRSVEETKTLLRLSDVEIAEHLNELGQAAARATATVAPPRLPGVP